MKHLHFLWSFPCGFPLSDEPFSDLPGFERKSWLFTHHLQVSVPLFLAGLGSVTMQGARNVQRKGECKRKRKEKDRQTYRSVLAVDCRVAVITPSLTFRVANTRCIDVHVVTYRRVPLSMICMYPYQLSLSAFRRFSPLSSALLSLR